MPTLSFPFSDTADPARALLAVLLDLHLSTAADESFDDDEDDAWEGDDGAMFLDSTDDANGNDVTSGSASDGWKACPLTHLPAGLAEWTSAHLDALPDAERTGMAVVAARRTQVHYHLGVDIMGTCDWRAAFPIRLQGHVGWLVVEWDAGDEDVPPLLPHRGMMHLLIGPTEDEVAAIILRRQ